MRTGPITSLPYVFHQNIKVGIDTESIPDVIAPVSSAKGHFTLPNIQKLSVAGDS